MTCRCKSAITWNGLEVARELPRPSLQLPKDKGRQLYRVIDRCSQFWTRLDRLAAEPDCGNDARRDKQSPCFLPLIVLRHAKQCRRTKGESSTLYVGH